MSDEWRQEQGRRAARRRSRNCGRRRRPRERREEPEIDESLLTPEELAYREVRRLAERKVQITGDTLKWALITTLLLIFIWPIGVIVLVVGGWRLFKDFYQLIVEPKLRERFVAREVDHQVRATLSRERRALEGEHARSMEQLSASIAHEIRNPITAAKSLVQQMGEDLRAPENVEYARVALEELGRVEQSVTHLLRFARDEELHPGEVKMADVIDSALETFRERVVRAGIRLEREIDREGALIGDAEKLRRVIINLVGNAVEALEESRAPDPRIEVQMGENLAGSQVWVRVKDNGPGIDPGDEAKIFSPFFTSKANGTGLGLAITRKVVEAHGGSIELHSEPGRGVEFLLTLPKQPTEGGTS